MKFYTDRLTNAGTSITTHGFISFTNSRLLANSSSADEFIDNLNNLKRRIGDELGELKKDARDLIFGDDNNLRWRRAYQSNGGKIYFSDDDDGFLTQRGFDDIDGSEFPPSRDKSRGAPVVGTQKGDTGYNAKMLRRKLVDAGYQPSTGQAAHHLVESTDPAAIEARKILSKFGIDINSADNGVFLDTDTHIFLHNNSNYPKGKYTQYVIVKLSDAETRGEAIEILANIRSDILSGKIYDKIRES